MTGDGSGGVLKQVHRLFNVGAVGSMTDAQLLERFISLRDEAGEAAFEGLVIRHGPMVLDVCRRVLHDAHDAEDSFQATFLVLADRAGSIVRHCPAPRIPLRPGRSGRRAVPRLVLFSAPEERVRGIGVLLTKEPRP